MDWNAAIDTIRRKPFAQRSYEDQRMLEYENNADLDTGTTDWVVKTEDWQVEGATKDGQTYRFNDARYLYQSGLLKDMLEDVEDPKGDPQTIPLLNVGSLAVLQKIDAYFRLHFLQPAPEIEKPIRGHYANYILQNDFLLIKDLTEAELVELINAANYMNVPPLVELGSVRISDSLQGLSPKQIKEKFGIKTDFSDEEKRRIREQNNCT